MSRNPHSPTPETRRLLESIADSLSSIAYSLAVIAADHSDDDESDDASDTYLDGTNANTAR